MRLCNGPGKRGEGQNEDRGSDGAAQWTPLRAGHEELLGDGLGMREGRVTEDPL